MSYKAYDKNTMAKAKLVSVNVSTKQAIELCKFIKKFKDVDKAISVLERVILKKQPVPFTRFTEGAGHKPGIGPGKYPIKASKLLLRLLREVKTNALSRNLDVDGLRIVHLAANKASRPYKYGRFLRRLGKRTHIEVIVESMPKPTQTKLTQTKPTQTKGLEKTESFRESKKMEKLDSLEKVREKTEDNKVISTETKDMSRDGSMSENEDRLKAKNKSERRDKSKTKEDKISESQAHNKKN